MTSFKPALNRPIQPEWQAADDYIADKLLPKDESLEAALESHALQDLPQISVAPNQGKMLYLMALAQKASSILEIGTLAGYSTIWLARAAKAKKGRVTTLEFEKKHADVARENLKRAGLMEHVTLVEGDARHSLKRLVEVEKLFDFVFIDANKEGESRFDLFVES
jgi:predicted O-methyltransferase YrrM